MYSCGPTSLLQLANLVVVMHHCSLFHIPSDDCPIIECPSSLFLCFPWTETLFAPCLFGSDDWSSKCISVFRLLYTFGCYYSPPLPTEESNNVSVTVRFFTCLFVTKLSRKQINVVTRYSRRAWYIFVVSIKAD